MKPYVVNRNQLNIRGSAESYCSRGRSRKTGTLEEMHVSMKTVSCLKLYISGELLNSSELQFQFW